MLAPSLASFGADRPYESKAPCRSVIFRVISVGFVAEHGISRSLADASCRVPPLKAPLRISVDECLRVAEKRLWVET